MLASENTPPLRNLTGVLTGAEKLTMINVCLLKYIIKTENLSEKKKWIFYTRRNINVGTFLIISPVLH